MKKVILDTDIGVDCDDAIALALLINLSKLGKCKIEAITTSTTRIGAISTIKSIFNYYDYNTIIGKMTYPVLPCDDLSLNKYALNIMNDFKFNDECEDSVKVFRKILANTKEKITVITIGPLTNIAKVLKSQEDEISSKTGLELFNEKVEEVYTMGGCFNPSNNEPAAEWNIIQDAKSAKYVMDSITMPATLIPAEVGRIVYTGQSLHKKEDNPVYRSLKYFHIFDNNFREDIVLSRESWDPITCLIAVLGSNHLFDFSPYGKISVDDEGVTTLKEDEGMKHRYVKLNGKIKEIEDSINKLLVR